MSRDIIFRNFRSKDYLDVESLWRETGLLSSRDRKRTYEQKSRDKPDLFIVAECEGEIVGTVYGFNPYIPSILSDFKIGYVGHLAVHPSQQGKGLGSLLLDEIIIRLAERGNRYALLFADSSGGRAEDLRMFYGRRHGFSRVWNTYYKKIH